MESSVEFGLYVKETKHGGLLLICLYVDDLLVTGDVQQEIEEFKSEMKATFLLAIFLASNLFILHMEF